MIRIGICDDELFMTTDIEKRLLDISEKIGIQLETEVFFDGTTLLRAVKEGLQFDILYLDIEMKIMDGINTAKEVRVIDSTVLIIYISGYENYLRELFQVDTFQFLDKPINDIKFEETFLRAYRKIVNSNELFQYSFNKIICKVRIKDIYYFESHGRTITIVGDKNEKFNGKLNDVEKQLMVSKIDFLRIHQSYLINSLFIKKMGFSSVMLENGQELNISEDRQKAIRTKYCAMLERENN